MRIVAAVGLISLLAVAPASAKPHPDKHDKHAKHVQYVQQHDVLIIREYYAPQYRALPPGIAKKYARTGELPPGWAKKVQPLPIELERRLVVLPPEYRRGYLDGHVIVYAPRTHSAIEVVSIFDR